MDVRAIVLSGIPVESAGTSVSAAVASAPETFSGVPLSLLPIMGKPLLHRIADRLKQTGVDSVSVLNASDASLPLTAEACRADLNWKDVSPEQVWRAAEEEFDRLVQAGAEIVLVLRLGAYAEVEIDPLLQFHLDQRNHTTQVVAADGPLDFFVLSGSRRNDAAFLLRSKLTKMRVATQPFATGGYVNRLQNVSELRQLVLDTFALKTSIQPLGEQVRPGIWVGPGARIERGVRLVAPCYIGASSKIRAGALITRGSSVEHHCVVDCGTVVESSTLLPLSYVGAGLDLMHSVVGSKRIVSVKYSAELDVEDNTLVSTVPATSALRTLNHAANLVAFIPRQMIRNIFGERKLRKSQADVECPEPSFDPGAVARPVGQDRQSLTSTAVAGMREYGNQ
jgi:carbonic anhydrase/acetyltransferase-like protein (isoleucine patch superfamily)